MFLNKDIIINGKTYTAEEAANLKGTLASIYGKDSFMSSLGEFLAEWYNSSPLIKVHTSGSTGTPKELWVEKKRMINSARMTVSFLGLKAGDSALLCMPLPYIAGKMVVVRSIIASLNLMAVTPCGRPLQCLTKIPDFAAMIPMQVFNSLKHPEDREKLMKIRHLIIGGGAIDKKMAEELKSFPNSVWSTYGMTETLSHIALRRLNGKAASEWYTPFDNVSLAISDEGTLIISAPSVNPETLITNDIVEFNEQRQFRILGRKDNTINTGGIKVQIEQVEEKLSHYLPEGSYMITSVPDSKFGEKIVMLISQEMNTDNAVNSLPLYWKPKHIIHFPKLPLTGTGKPDRAKAKVIASEQLQCK